MLFLFINYKKIVFLRLLFNAPIKPNYKSLKFSKLTMKKFFLGSLIFSLSILSACNLGCHNKNVATENTRSLLHGKWTMREAESDGKKTTLLDGTTFEFTEDGKIKTNLPLLSEGNYDLEEGKILQKSPIKVQYAIQTLDTTHLVLAFNLKERDFKLSFQKGN